MSENLLTTEQVIIEVMRHFGFRRNYQVAEYFDVTPQTLSGWIKTGEIPPKHLIKFNKEIASNKISTKSSDAIDRNKINDLVKYEELTNTDLKISVKKIKKIIKSNIKQLILIPIATFMLSIVYSFIIAQPVYTSLSKVLPVSEDGTSQGGFTGMAAQLGINVPLSLGGKIPWDEIYPEIVTSNDLMIYLLDKTFISEKYGNNTLENLIISEYNINGETKKELTSRAIIDLKEKINISKNRLSPVINLSVNAFEPSLAVEISKEIISESSKIQRRLKTNRVRQKREFIEERLTEISNELKSKEDELRVFREKFKNEDSPSLNMMVQSMGREIDLQNSVYMTLNSQYEKAKIDEVETEDMVQLIDGPTFPIYLTSPNRKLIMGLSLFIGLFLAIFSIYLKEYILEQ